MIGLIEKPPRRDFDWTHNAESLDPMQATLYRLGGWSGFRHTQPPMLRHTPTYKGPTPPKKTKAILQFCTRLTNEDWGGDLGIRDRVAGLVQHGTAKVMHSVGKSAQVV